MRYCSRVRWCLNAAIVALLADVVVAGSALPPVLASQKAGPASQPTSRLGAEPSAAEASQAYFHAASRIISELAERIGSGPSSSGPMRSVTFLRQGAGAIGQLPRHHVDPDLVQWGTQVQRQLAEAAKECAEAQKGMLARLKTNQAGNQKTAASQRSLLLKEHSDRAYQAASSMLKNVQQTQSEIRSKMAERYEVEF